MHAKAATTIPVNQPVSLPQARILERARAPVPDAPFCNKGRALSFATLIDLPEHDHSTVEVALQISAAFRHVELAAVGALDNNLVAFGRVLE